MPPDAPAHATTAPARPFEDPSASSGRRAGRSGRRRGGARSRPPAAVPAGLDELAPLVEAAATLDLADTGAGTWLREQGHRVTSRLAATGRLPQHLVVRLDDPVVVVVRTLAATPRR